MSSETSVVPAGVRRSGRDAAVRHENKIPGVLSRLILSALSLGCCLWARQTHTVGLVCVSRRNVFDLRTRATVHNRPHSSHIIANTRYRPRSGPAGTMSIQMRPRRNELEQLLRRCQTLAGRMTDSDPVLLFAELRELTADVPD